MAPLPEPRGYVQAAERKLSICTAADHLEWVGDLPYTTTYTNTSGDYEWGDSLGRGVLPGVKMGHFINARQAR